MHSQIRPRNPSRKNVSAGAGNTLLPIMRKTDKMAVDRPDHGFALAGWSTGFGDRTRVRFPVRARPGAGSDPDHRARGMGQTATTGRAQHGCRRGLWRVDWRCHEGGHMRAEGATRPGLAGYLGSITNTAKPPSK